MPAASGPSCRVAIVGASSLAGKDLRQCLEESSFPAGDIRLLDEEVAVGTLTEAGGEPVVIGALDQDSFERVRFAFFAGNNQTTAGHWEQARRAGAVVIDLSEKAAEIPGIVAWVPGLDRILAPPRPPQGELFHSPGSAAIIACSVAAALAPFAVQRLVMVFLRPVSERGQPGIDELESQTINLLSLKPISQEVFDAQVAFNLLARYGAESRPCLQEARAAIARDVANYLAGRVALPAIQLIQAPVFYAYTFSAFVELAAPRPPAELETALCAAGIRIQGADDAAPSNSSVAEESQPVLARIEPDLSYKASYWLWGAADNLRLASKNAVDIAGRLLAS